MTYRTKQGTRARQRLALLRRCGLMQDDISDFTVQRGLILTGADGREHPAWAQLRQAGKFCLLTSSQLGEITGAASPTGRVYLLENQMLFSSLCRKSRLQHPLVCTSGQLKEASWQLEQIACPALRPTAQAVLAERHAGYQEALAEQYLEDLRNPGE